MLNPVTGEELEGDNVEGVLVFKNTWPSIARTVWQDHNRWLDVYMRVCLPLAGTGEVADGEMVALPWILLHW